MHPFKCAIVMMQLQFLKLPSLIEGLHAKGVYIGFWADFHFLQDQANFWQTDLF